MVYFSSRDTAAIALCAALWGILNVTVSPIFFAMTHLPFVCDLIGYTCLILATWWTKKFGAASTVGFIATALSLVLRPEATQFLGFTVASILFDITTRLVGYKTCFVNPKSSAASLITLSIISGALAGYIIGSFIMAQVDITKLYGTLLVFVGLHAIGGLIGGILGFILVRGLDLRGVVAAKIQG